MNEQLNGKGCVVANKGDNDVDSGSAGSGGSDSGCGVKCVPTIVKIFMHAINLVNVT